MALDKCWSTWKPISKIRTVYTINTPRWRIHTFITTTKHLCFDPHYKAQSHTKDQKTVGNTDIFQPSHMLLLQGHSVRLELFWNSQARPICKSHTQYYYYRNTLNSLNSPYTPALFRQREKETEKEGARNILKLYFHCQNKQSLHWDKQTKPKLGNSYLNLKYRKLHNKSEYHIHTFPSPILYAVPISPGTCPHAQESTGQKGKRKKDRQAFPITCTTFSFRLPLPQAKTLILITHTL